MSSLTEKNHSLCLMSPYVLLLTPKKQEDNSPINKQRWSSKGNHMGILIRVDIQLIEEMKRPKCWIRYWIRLDSLNHGCKETAEGITGLYSCDQMAFSLYIWTSGTWLPPAVSHTKREWLQPFEFCGKVVMFYMSFSDSWFNAMPEETPENLNIQSRPNLSLSIIYL